MIADDDVTAALQPAFFADNSYLDVENLADKESETAVQAADDFPTIGQSKCAGPNVNNGDPTKKKRPKK
jgi:hypothetical protein